MNSQITKELEVGFIWYLRSPKLFDPRRVVKEPHDVQGSMLVSCASLQMGPNHIFQCPSNL